MTKVQFENLNWLCILSEGEKYTCESDRCFGYSKAQNLGLSNHVFQLCYWVNSIRLINKPETIVLSKLTFTQQWAAMVKTLQMDRLSRTLSLCRSAPVKVFSVVTWPWVWCRHHLPELITLHLITFTPLVTSQEKEQLWVGSFQLKKEVE